MLTPAASACMLCVERLPGSLIPLRCRKRVNPNRPSAVCGSAAARCFRQRPVAIKMLPTWLAVATMVNAPAAQIAIVMPDVCHAGRDIHVTHVDAYVTAPQHKFARRCSVMIRNLIVADWIVANRTVTKTMATSGIAS